MCIRDSDDVVLSKPFDNKCVSMGSNFIGKGQEDTCRTWDKQRKEYIQVKRPEVIKCYNMSMGGVDKLDFLVSIYRIFIKSRNWTL